MSTASQYYALDLGGGYQADIEACAESKVTLGETMSAAEAVGVQRCEHRVRERRTRYFQVKRRERSIGDWF